MSTRIGTKNTVRSLAFAVAILAFVLNAGDSLALEQGNRESDSSQSAPGADKIRLESLPFKRIADLQIGAGLITPIIGGSFDGSAEFYPVDHLGLGLSGGYLAGPGFLWTALYGYSIGMDLNYRFDLAVVRHREQGSIEQFSLGPVVGFTTVFVDQIDIDTVGGVDDSSNVKTLLGFELMCSFQYTFWKSRNVGFNLRMDSGLSFLFPVQDSEQVKWFFLLTILRVRLGVAL